MPDFIKNILIDNFKSLCHCKLDDCKRINLLIGGPNTGKSNLLEALSLFSIPFLRENASKKVSDLIRLKYPVQLFYNGDFKSPIAVTTNREKYEIRYQPEIGMLLNIQSGESGGSYIINNKLNLRWNKNDQYSSSIRKFDFLPNITFRELHQHYLIPPHGDNLLNVLEENRSLRTDISGLLKTFELPLVMDGDDHDLKIMQYSNQPPDDIREICLIPYSSMANSIQRIIFYKTAIKSNDNTVLLFDEPEAYISPAYISGLAQDIMDQSDNQYFMSVKGPQFIKEFLDRADDELAVFFLEYRNGQTEVKRLSGEEIRQIS
jgi:AAA15 family ATPase/GTPase